MNCKLLSRIYELPVTTPHSVQNGRYDGLIIPKSPMDVFAVSYCGRFVNIILRQMSHRLRLWRVMDALHQWGESFAEGPSGLPGTIYI